MLYSVLLKLKTERAAVISPTQGYHAHALFLNLVRQANHKMAEALHDSAVFKPFTISSLQGELQRSGRYVKLSPDSCSWIRLTFLKDDLFAVFMDSVLKAASQPLFLESAVFHIDQLVVSQQDSPLCRFQSYEELLSTALPQRDISLEFLAATTFRSGGKRNVTFPEPSLVFGSYFSKWQHFAPPELRMDEMLPKQWSRLIVARYRLATRILDFGSYQEVGFEGRCAFQIGESMAEPMVRALNALADFAFYCGTGAKTTMGMGQTRRLK